MSVDIKTYHLIAIGGSVMHNMALALKKLGHHVTGSDDEIFEPAKSRLSNAGLLPASEGWDATKIHTGIDAIILGMHAKADNPELLKAQELGIPIYSFPDFVFQQCQNKQRIVIGGSHGKTTITSMILHVLKTCNRKFDYLVGAQIEGFDTMVKITDEAPCIIIEGDEYLTSPLDRVPKFHKYNHHIGLMSGIAWDHVNVFPTFDNYVEQFRIFAQKTPKAGTIMYNEEDPLATRLANDVHNDNLMFSYKTHEHEIKDGITYLITPKKERVPVQVFGKHNMSNLGAAKLICHRLSIDDDAFYKAIQTFKGAGNRLQLLASGISSNVYKDFAHAPSKVKATIDAVKSQFTHRTLTAVFELHTYSSLNKDFLYQYKGYFDKADNAVIYFNPHSLEIKKLPPLTLEIVQEALNNPKVIVLNNSADLTAYLERQTWKNHNLLLMSSGNFDNLNMNELATNLVAQS